MNYVKDTVYLVVLVLLLPLLMLAAWTALIVIVVRQLYWWTRGSSTPLTRHAGPQTLLAERWRLSIGRRRLLPPPSPEPATDFARS